MNTGKKQITGNELQHLILDAGIQKKELAKRVGCSYNYIRQILKEQRKATVLRIHLKSLLTRMIKEQGKAA